MEKLGKNLNCDFFTFRYPGREPRSVPLFLQSRPDVKNLFIYDLCLTTGTLLYSCAGGIGVTKERHIADMHSSIKAGTFSSSVETYLCTQFKHGFNKRVYTRLRERYNGSFKKPQSILECTKLYSLWLCSNFSHKYGPSGGYNGNYLPRGIDFSLLKNASNVSKQKNLLFRNEDLFSFPESIINENLVLYFHLPDCYGKYGVNFYWNKKIFKEAVQIIKELGQFGYKICVSASYLKRGKVPTDYRHIFPELSNVYIEQFKVSKLDPEFVYSDIYLLNF
jgi:hypothetical protein